MDAQHLPSGGGTGGQPRAVLAGATRVVVKVGTRVLTRDDGLPALSRLFALVEQVADLRRAGRDVLLVSSGAVGLGRERLKLTPPLTLEDRQACAAVGQSRLMALYEQGFSRFGLECAQLLLTRSDFDSRLHYLSLRGALASLLRRGVVPVINENDAVATDELAAEPQSAAAPAATPGAAGDAGGAAAADGTSPAAASSFGDNDQLSALVAAKLDADLLILLTDVPGVFADLGAQREPGAASAPPPVPLDEVREDELSRLAATVRTPASKISRGGMSSKLTAAGIAARAGCHAVIASGFQPDVLPRICAGERCGTWVRARPGLAAKRRWIAFASRPRGRLYLDAGAIAAIAGRGASLLAAGVTRVSGDFRRGDVVELCEDASGEVVGRGIVHCDAQTARAWMQGDRPPGVRSHDALVHRDNLALATAAGRGQGADVDT